ncbi:hypothetical protein [Flavobacterium granuli]|uniref:PEP-CTERM protein-sorting domain-containing protein n=1 Tax=Flavobacterium granuli TaxID=280093 RepID=A0A1M5PD48_9FLAO|nr:hypothetical protein [Flavobacterium granuli]PRZ26437.1 hypothetical protein BC624_102408 [Flavobacterium granuli]SHG99637.1 hypothetical protein SAMN05443373_1065 [Flavobacterium granuli]
MKIGQNKFYLLIAFLSGVFVSWAKFSSRTPPAPASPMNTPPPDGFPIDENILILIIVALFFGFFTIYKHRLKAKAPN